MSIFTRLNLFIALAITSVIIFVVFVDQILLAQDKLTLEYREVARQENTLNRVQSNVLEERVALQTFRKTYDDSALGELKRREKTVREQLTLARKLNAAPPITLEEFERLEREYDKARKGYVKEVNQLQTAAQEGMTLGTHSHPHTKNIDLVIDDLNESLRILARTPTANSITEALVEELERFVLIAAERPEEIEYIKKIVPVINRIEEHKYAAQEHMNSIERIGPLLSRLIENAKLELIEKQNTLGPQLTAKIGQFYTSLLLGSAVIVVFLLSLAWWSRHSIFKPLGNSLNRLHQNQQRLDSANAATRKNLHLDTAAAAQEPAQQANEIQQLDQMASSLGVSLTLSENLSATLKQQEAQIAELQKREAVDNLVAGMSHNLNNYLQPILLLSQHMNKPDKDAETQQMLSVITESAMNARNVLDKVLALSRADAREQLASTDSLTTVISLVSSTARASETIETDIQTHPHSFALAASDLNTVVLNLMNNSLDSRDALTPITLWITGKVIEDGYKITVRDNGSGMDASTLAKAMNKFFTTKPVGKGTGLGLSEARELMEAVGGQLDITSTLGEGTTVSLNIPFSQHAESSDG